MNNFDSAKLEAKLTHLRSGIHRFLVSHRTEITQVASNLPHVFEAMCYVLVVRYYESAGCMVEPKGLLDGKFRFKYNTNGDPWKYSYFTVLCRDEETGTLVPVAEVRHNQVVSGYWRVEIGSADTAPYFAADVAVVHPNIIPTNGPPKNRKGTVQKPPTWVRNEDLITFAEAKRLVAYPMLLAQFYGIVHEIKPNFLGDQITNDATPLLYPILFTDDLLTLGAKKVILSFVNRRLTIAVVPNVSLGQEKDLIELMRKGISGLVLETQTAPVTPVYSGTKTEAAARDELKLFADLGL